MFEHAYIDVNGIRMHYVRAGQGERLLLLLHGFPECWYSWRHQLAALSERFTVVAPDLRGYNETDAPSWGYELDVLVTDAAQLIQALGYRRAYVAGHDWGGIIAWSLAMVCPHLVERLVICNAPHLGRYQEEVARNPLQGLRSSYVALFQLPWLPEALIRAGDFAVLEYLFRGMAVHKQQFTDEDIQVYKQALSRPGSLTAALNYYRALFGQGNRGMFRGTGMMVHMPTLVVWGEQDPALGMGLIEGLERYVPDLRIRTIPDSSHWVQQDTPEAVNQAMREFLPA
ncbi:MAG TPA: alpha/beta hydrolase [Roseiflexaceae bacterium]|nr:alpha/beta hydrolase [Roseiflexaceae bacterium]